MQKSIYEYYEKLAPVYDQDRFGNSYGKYIHEQETRILSNLNLTDKDKKVLDLGCGTGRLLGFASHGADFSLSMIEQAQLKFPDKPLVVREADHTGFQGSFFDDTFSFHVLMHLDKQKTLRVLDEAHWILKKGGRFIFDIPSRKRRQLVKHRQLGWHGANDFTISEIKEMIKDKWELKEVRGVLFMPVHRFPVFLRKIIWIFDTLLCKSFLKEYASYLVFVIEKK